MSPFLATTCRHEWAMQDQCKLALTKESQKDTNSHDLPEFLLLTMSHYEIYRHIKHTVERAKNTAKIYR